MSAVAKVLNGRLRRLHGKGWRANVRTAGVLPRLSPVGRSRATFIDCDAWLQINASRRPGLNASATFVARASSSGQLGGIATADDDVSVPTNVRICVAGRRQRRIRSESRRREHFYGKIQDWHKIKCVLSGGKYNAAAITSVHSFL